MANLQGTAGKDVVTVNNGDSYSGLAGDDEITVITGNVSGDAGNDKLTVAPGSPWANIWYWSSPGVIYVDMEQGYALDGFGGTDTLVNVHSVHGFKNNGDKGFGTSGTDYFWISAWTTNAGKIQIDGRGGTDTVTLAINTQQNLQNSGGLLTFSASADGRLITARKINATGFTYELKNVEIVNLYDNDTQVSTALNIDSLIDFTKAGPDILLRGATGFQMAAMGQATTITYSFLTAAPATGGEGGQGFTAFTAAQQQTVRDILTKLQAQTGLMFSEVAGSAGQMRFGINEQTSTRGYSFLPDSYRTDEKGGDVWLDVQTATLLSPGQEGYYVLLHEMAHALGLQHALTESDTSGATVLLNRFSSTTNTVMLDVPAQAADAAWPSWYGAFDLQALRYLYGSKTYATGNDNYVLGDAAGKSSYALVDEGGTDTLDASGASVSTSIDLRQNHASSIGLDAAGKAAVGNIGIATGTNIENAVGTGFDDVLTGNDLPNTLKGKGGNDLIDGPGGRDWAVFNYTRASAVISKTTTSNQWNVVATDGISGSAQLSNIERIQFSNAVLATDLGVTDNAGKALLLLGAVLGKQATLAKAGLVGTAIGFFDQGFSTPDLAGALMRLPIWGGVLTPSNSSDDIAGYLFRVVNGRAATAAELSVGSKSVANDPAGTYLASLAGTAANIAQIDLVGLAAIGFEYPIL